MLNYIFELLSFIVAVACYLRSDMDGVVIWLSATLVFGICSTVADCVYKKNKEAK